MVSSTLKVFSRRSANVAVIGGGISGVMCSLELARSGLQVDLFDQNKLLERTRSCVRRVNLTGFHYDNIADQLSVGRSNRKWLLYLLNEQPQSGKWVGYEYAQYNIMNDTSVSGDHLEAMIRSIRADYDATTELQLPGITSRDLIIEQPMVEETEKSCFTRSFMVLEARMKMGPAQGSLAYDLQKMILHNKNISVYESSTVSDVFSNSIGLAHSVEVERDNEKVLRLYDVVLDCSNSNRLSQFKNFPTDGKFKFSCVIPLTERKTVDAAHKGSCLNVWSDSGWGISIIPEDNTLMLTAEPVSKKYNRLIHKDEYATVLAESIEYVCSKSRFWAKFFHDVDMSSAFVAQNYVLKPTGSGAQRGEYCVEHVAGRYYKCYADKVANALELSLATAKLISTEFKAMARILRGGKFYKSSIDFLTKRSQKSDRKKSHCKMS